MKRRCFFVAIVLLTVFGISNPVQSADWLNWRGPSENGISSETAWNPKAISNSSAIAWKVNVGVGHSAVVVKGDRLYTSGTRKSSEVVLCLSAGTGAEIWVHSYPGVNRDFPGPAATPALDGSFVYTISRGGLIHCLNAADGKVVWSKDLISASLAKTPEWGFSSSPVIAGELLILNAGKSGLALNKKTGAVVWASDPLAGALTTPVLFSQGGQQLATFVAGGALWAVAVKTGKVAWSHPWHSDSDPIVVGSRLYLTGAGRGKGSTLLELASGQPEQVWKTRNVADLFQTGVVIDGHAYGFGKFRGKDRLACVEVASGELKWNQDLGEWGALTAAAGKLIIIDGDGDLVIAEANPAAFKVIASAKVMTMKGWLDYPKDRVNACWTAPVLANGRIYARNSHGDLVCLDVRR